jgi:CMP-N,N'-diacetyllegionaminic acid synthase
MAGIFFGFIETHLSFFRRSKLFVCLCIPAEKYIGKMETIGVIPARGGSKGIPRKNIRDLFGMPLIYFSIVEALKSTHLSRIIVSTDDEEISEISREYGADVIIRPAEYSTDEARTELALIHVIETLKQDEGYEIDAVVTLEPTSPLRTANLIDRCVEALMSTDADAVISVVQTSALVGRIIEDRFDYLIKNQPRRRQERAPLYRESSTVYATMVDTLFETRSVLGTHLCPVVAEAFEAIDINEELDFAIVEAVMRWREEKK